MHTDRFTPLNAAVLLRWMRDGLARGDVFGIPPRALLHAPAG